MSDQDSPTLDAEAPLVVRLIEGGGSYQSRLSPEAQRWREENAEFIRAHQAHIDEFGVFGEEFRNW